MFKSASHVLPRDGETAHLSVPLFACSGTEGGPRLVVTGPETLIRMLADTCWSLAVLRDIRGALVLRADAQDPVFDRPDAVLALGDCSLEAAVARVLARMGALDMLPGHRMLERVA